ncbi:MAG: haloacid dehalogenase-like hydrolase [Microcella sp.]|uniref:HAD family hydrolase n=1 Tax=Microcella sp. TaxID=1913979 RepID=UPI0033151B26
MTTTILWDVDGTLLVNAYSGGGELYHSAVERTVGRELGPPLPRTHGKPDGLILSEILAHFGYGDDWHERARAVLDELSVERAERGDRRETAPGVEDALRACAAHGWRNALLTGNSLTRSRVKLEGAGLTPETLGTAAFDWEHSFFGATARDRSEITSAARAALPEDALVIIGDTPRDDEAARAAGIPFIAVATGAFTVDELQQTEALLVVPDLVAGRDAVLDAIAALPAPPRVG